MAWPTQNAAETDLDAGTDSPANARDDLLLAVQNVNTIRTARDQADGVAGLDQNGRLAGADYVRHKGSGLLYNTDLGSVTMPAGAGTFMSFQNDTDTFGGITNRAQDATRLTVPSATPAIQYVRVCFGVYFYGSAVDTIIAYARLFKNGAVLNPEVLAHAYSPLGGSARSLNGSSAVELVNTADYFQLYISHSLGNGIKFSGRFWLEVLQ